jgi:hypothetical protein
MKKKKEKFKHKLMNKNKLIDKGFRLVSAKIKIKRFQILLKKKKKEKNLSNTGKEVFKKKTFLNNNNHFKSNFI